MASGQGVLFRGEGLRRLQLGPIDIELRRGESVVVSGASGSGKSQLLRTFANLDPFEGELWLAGRPMGSYPPHQWRRQVALLPAEPAWWGERVGEHFWRDMGAELAALGFEAGVLDWQVDNCSTGERQRLALLRLLQNEPLLILLDEVTASLDEVNTARVEELLDEYRKRQQATLLWVSHDSRQVARVAGRVLELRNGQLGERAA